MKNQLALFLFGALLLLATPASAQNTTCPTAPVGTSNNQCASTAFVQNQFAVAVPITVGSTTIVGGTPGYVVYDNSGVVGEIAPTGSGLVVLNTSPTIANPAFTGSVTGNNTIPLGILAQSAANTMLGNWSASTANVTANSMPSCADTGGNHLNYVSGTGITCGTGIGNGITALTGDGTATGPGSVAFTLATVNTNTGSWGSATQAPQFTVNAKGLVTAAANVTVTPAVGSITGLGTGVAAALGINVGSAGAFTTSASNLPYTAPSGSSRFASAKFFESTPSIVDWGGLGNNSQDNATAFNTALANVTSGTFGGGVPYAITFPQGTFNFGSKPNSDNLGVNYLGVNRSQTGVLRTYNEATPTNGIFTRVQSGGQVANGCRLENINVQAGNGTTGGSGLSYIGAASPNGPDFCGIANATVTYVGTGAYSASGASLYVDGSAITSGAIGIRDMKLNNVELFTNGWPTALLKSVVDFEWYGGNIAGLVTDTLTISGTVGVPSTNVTISVGNIDALSIDHTNGCNIRANSILGAVTIDSTAVGCNVYSDQTIGGTVTNNSTTSCVYSGKLVIGAGCPGVIGAVLQTTTVTAPTGTTSGTPVMMGLGATCKITPVTSGRVRMGIRGALGNTAATITSNSQFKYGTGTAPANAAASTGTSVGGNIGVTSPAGASAVSAFAQEAVLSGLTVGTQYWFDIALGVNAGASVMNAVSCDAFEF